MLHICLLLPLLKNFECEFALGTGICRDKQEMTSEGEVGCNDNNGSRNTT